MLEKAIVYYRELNADPGYQGAFEKLYTSAYAPVFRFIVMRLKSRDEAEDVTQDVFIKFLNALPQYRAQGSMLPYLFTVARNAVIDHLRRKKPTYDDDALLQIASSEPTAEERSGLGEEVAEVMGLLSQLSEAEEAVVKLRYLDGLATYEVAKLLGKNEDAVRQLLSRGLKRLRILCESRGL